MQICIPQKIRSFTPLHLPMKPLLPALLFFGIWQMLTAIGNLPAFILPSPFQVAQRFLQAATDGSLLRHATVTLLQTLGGLGLGVLTAVLLAYFLHQFPVLERMFAPYIVASQAVPVVAVAPLLILWFGPGYLSKLIICALIVFFPILTNTMLGLRSVPVDLRDLLRSLHATQWQTLYLLEIPAALPYFFTGLRIGATLSVIGAVVGEFIGAKAGLGFLINLARGQYDTTLVFVTIFTLIGMALGLYSSVVVTERMFLKHNTSIFDRQNT